jgi:hypothetical protein
MHHFDLNFVFSDALKAYKDQNYHLAQTLFQSIIDEMDESEIESEKYGDMRLYSDTESYLNLIEYYFTEGYEIKRNNPALEIPLTFKNFFNILFCRKNLHSYDSRIIEKYDVNICNHCGYQEP